MDPLILGMSIGFVCFIVILIVKIIPNMKQSKKDEDEYLATTQDNLVFDSIKRGTVKLKQGGYRKVVEIPGINVQLMDDSEIETVFFVYKEILNSIEFDYQVVQQSKVLDISEYLELLDSKIKVASNPISERELEVYREFVKNVVDDYSILTKKSYLVIPFDEEKEKKKNMNTNMNAYGKKVKKKKGQQVDDETNEEQMRLEEAQRFDMVRRELESRAVFVERSFRRLGVEPKILDDEDLFDLYYTAYNKDRSVVQPMYRRNPKQFTTTRVKFDGGGE
ncbi:hypothetical protein [Bacillus bombysepticus]|uniref:hypothetical protein n=1 Tax=Bacillus bombysepticus TaxID=658666 RepID=UPI003015E6B0